LQAAYDSGDWGRYQGNHCRMLREQMIQQLGTSYVQLCCSGTFAVELALRALAVAAGDEVVLAGYDFAGNFRAIEDVGARPVLVDLAADSWCLDPLAVEQAVGPRTRAILVSHLHGTLADMPRLRALADRHGLAIVEDACQCPGAMIGSRPAGTWGDCGVWSFGGSKLLTAGRGGAMFTSRPEVAQRAKIFCERGNDAFALSELQAAVLLPQLELLPASTLRRREVAATILGGLSHPNAPLLGGKTWHPVGEPPQSAYYKLGLWYNVSQKCDTSLDIFLAALQAEGVAVDRGFRGFVRRPASRCRKIGELPHSKRASERTTVLHHPILLQGTQAAQQILTAIEKVSRYFQLERH
jgi:perosamine synthetase